MSKLIVPLAVLLAAVSVTGATGGTQAPAAAKAPDRTATVATAPRISVADAKKALGAGKAVLVDVRSAVAYQQEHAKGAISLPGFEIQARMKELPKDKQIITYCT